MNPKHFFSSLVFLGILAITLQPSHVAGVNIANVITPKFFNSIISKSSSSCEGKHFYTRAHFLNATKSFPKFGHRATNLASKRELAAFFAHVTHETGHFCYIREIDRSRKYCFESCKCPEGKKYYGRGPIQLTWNCNYKAAGKYLKLDLLNHPELVAKDPYVAFKTALWYWKTRVVPRLREGFAGTIRAINGGECGGGNPTAVANRVTYYKKYCKAFGVTPGPNLSC